MINIWVLLTIFVLSGFVGYFAIKGVSPILHSPLMSVTNAISGIIIIGAILISGQETINQTQILGLLAIVLASINIFGGFAISHRILIMFKKKQPTKKQTEEIKND